MTPEEQKEKCLKCEYCRYIQMSHPTFNILGCGHAPYKGKWVVEIETCPKEK